MAASGGQGRFDRLLLGSVSQAMLHHALPRGGGAGPHRASLMPWCLRPLGDPDTAEPDDDEEV
ncbi:MULTISPECIES: universal stress protein [unclassified Streptomyces]|uniref:universal stress protein n=1 Tax=unclassified Streptomyces TaxID=2593676 RepID=UPI000C07EEE8|nr:MULTISPECIES: universal stress protein [unclassified Streptomyces]MYQ40727.1 hypothetical protein [Streptomyces sp. SID4921]